MYSARREGRELGQLREAACLMYGARRGEERCTSVWGTGATQGALTSPHPSLRPPTGADRPLAALLGKTTARGRSAPPPAPRCPVSLPPHHPQPHQRSRLPPHQRSRLRFFAKDGLDQFSCPLRYGGRPVTTVTRAFIHAALAAGGRGQPRRRCGRSGGATYKGTRDGEWTQTFKPTEMR